MTLDLVSYKDKMNETKAPTIDELKQTRDKAETEQKKEKVEFASRAENIEVTYTFDKDNTKKRASITSKVMDHEARIRYDRVLQELSNGLAFDNLPIETKNRYICMARIVCQCVNAPDWLLEAAGEDLEFCYMLGGRLLDHESRFFRYSGGKGDGYKSEPRFSIS